ncbi:Uma2 family endonuclease [Actinomadura spongiicola]|uniref:Uma2 family endonuclease n=1 Tax=Actinomadura spongiicola TaxID=2303421 RepID=A0A372GJV8_9ACTN|nr:Uma2 family endonuclease [Actinomadura spongiicola]RFS85660.1 Uma2 family endonuclease [Actinomadura spongiicola]
MEESPKVSIIAAACRYHELPDTPYNLWMRDELADALELPHDGTRVEIIGGEMIVSPGPDYGHNAVIRGIQQRFFAAELTDPSFPWRCITTQDVKLSDIHDGYIPDLCVLSVENDKQARTAQLKKLPPRSLELVVEVTSPNNAFVDREPRRRHPAFTKWIGYARVGVPYYLLVDRDPREARTTLFTQPDPTSGEYRESVSWAFGEAVKLPEPFCLEIPTDEWEPWQRS